MEIILNNTITKTQLKKELKKLSISQKKFATIIGMSESTVNAWSDEKVPKWVNVIIKLLLENRKQKKVIDSMTIVFKYYEEENKGKI